MSDLPQPLLAHLRETHVTALEHREKRPNSNLQHPHNQIG
jgi:hypothetical protein